MQGKQLILNGLDVLIFKTRNLLQIKKKYYYNKDSSDKIDSKVA